MRTACLLLLACACATPDLAAGAQPPSRSPARRPGETPTALEVALLEDVADRRLDRFDILDASLVASGVRDEADLAAARASLRRATAPLEARLAKAEPEAGARALLVGLHQGAAGAPGALRQYVTDATTVLDIVERGAFNCVSATLLYVALARERGWDVRPVLLPSHARAVFVGGGASKVVETTSPLGFDASPEVSRSVVVRTRSDAGRLALYADERGTPVDDLALLGALYTNLSVAARERGELPAAAALEARADAFVADSARPLLARVRASTLTEMAVRRLDEDRTAEALALAREAVRILPAGPEAALVRDNLVAIAGRRIEELARADDEKAILALAAGFQAMPSVFEEISALGWNSVGEIRSRRGDKAGAAQAYRAAVKSGAGSKNEDVFAHNEAVAELHRLAELSESDPERARAEWKALAVPAGDAVLSQDKVRVGIQIANRCAVRLVEAQRCEEADARIAEWEALDPKASASQLRAECRGRVGMARFHSKDFAAAAKAFREAMRLYPAEPAYRQNVLAALQSQVDALLRARRCRDAAPLVAEGTALQPDDTFFAEARAFCERNGE